MKKNNKRRDVFKKREKRVYLLQEFACGQVVCFIGTIEVESFDHACAAFVCVELLNHHDVGVKVQFPTSINTHATTDTVQQGFHLNIVQEHITFDTSILSWTHACVCVLLVRVCMYASTCACVCETVCSQVTSLVTVV